MLSRALIDPGHGYTDPVLLEYVRRFNELLAAGESSTAEVAALALSYVAKTRRQSDQFAKVHFDDTVVDYRDDNRQLWKFIEEGDEEAAFDEARRPQAAEVRQGLPPRHYPEWDYQSQTYRRIGSASTKLSIPPAKRRTSTACWPSTPRWPNA